MSICQNSYTFQAPTCYIDNATETRLYEFTLLDCSDGETHTCEEYFNICDADIVYFNPQCESINQFLYFQLQFHDTLNSYPHWNGNTFVSGTPLYDWRRDPAQITPWFIKGEIYDICCNKIDDLDTSNFIVQANVMQKDGKSRQTIKIDATNLPTFFVFKFTTYDGRETYSPPFQKTCCEKMIKYTGVYNTGFNCANEFIGLPFVHTTNDPFGSTVNSWAGDPVVFVKEITFIGEAYPHAHNIEKTNNRTRTLKGVYQEAWQNWIERCPTYAAKELALILTSKTILVYIPELQGNFVFNGTLEKNEDSGTMWQPNFELIKWICDINSVC